FGNGIFHHRYNIFFPDTTLCRSNNLISSSAVNSTLPPEVCINSNSDLIALNDAKATWSLAFIAVFSASCKSVCKLIAFVFLKFRSEEHTSELQSRDNLVCCLLLE